MNQTLKRIAVIIEGETVRFRQTPYGKWRINCTCCLPFCDHRFKAIPQWRKFVWFECDPPGLPKYWEVHA